MLGLALVFGLSACSETPNDEDAQTVINNAWEKLSDKNAEHDQGIASFNGDGEIKVGASSIKMDGDIEVTYDSSNQEEVKTAIKMDMSGEGSFEGSSGEGAVKGEMITMGEKAYLLLENLEFSSGNAQTDMMANLIGNLYKGQWIALPTTDTGLLEEGDVWKAENFTGKEVAEIAKKHQIFKLKNEIAPRHYELEIDVPVLKQYLKEVGEVTGNPMTEEELLEVETAINSLEYSMNVKVDNNYDITWGQGSATIIDPTTADELMVQGEINIDGEDSDGKVMMTVSGEESTSVSMNFNSTLKNSKVSIEAPADAQDLDLGSLLGGAGGL